MYIKPLKVIFNDDNWWKKNPGTFMVAIKYKKEHRNTLVHFTAFKKKNMAQVYSITILCNNTSDCFYLHFPHLRKLILVCSLSTITSQLAVWELVDRFKSLEQRRETDFHSSFIIHHSSFTIHHSSCIIHHFFIYFSIIYLFLIYLWLVHQQHMYYNIQVI